MKILLTGATGLIGKKVGIELVRAGHNVVAVGRDKRKLAGTLPFPAQLAIWSEVESGAALQGVDAILHLAGEPVADGRWTRARKERILSSRVDMTSLLARVIDRMGEAAPTAFVSASAIGFYGDRGDETVDESSPPGEGFLAEVCRAWESAAALQNSRTRAALVRIGVVLSNEGGALAKLLPIFRAGLGGPVAGGAQWMSWVHIDDLVGILLHALSNSKVIGPINGVAPNPVTNAEFTRELARALDKPAGLPVPRAGLAAAFGEMGSVVATGQKVAPREALESGYRFRFETLGPALEDLTQNTGDLEFKAEQWIARPLEEVFAFFGKHENLEAITPPWLAFKVLKSSSPRIERGTTIDYELKLHGIPFRWKTAIEEWVPNERFVDVQLKGPYSKWRHTHTFERLGAGTLVRDHVRYRLPAGALGKLVAGWKVRGDVERIFAFRRSAIEKSFR